eukprot:CAMPEP_0201558100 /NCGR_PEP_ID=MMETSP0173_2-20130828/65768_1 /ASSEMBLY_ACC=CAM_ASM_000268 /TAXON_ID=218659 /ORGANISM="Vexillifera sp., Strain DIVA3 564/2" /LENGTH=373 /DNA_ID=CAMNT_0047971303 /DNA_START=374 /DNA_END=1492 /DNA_ORIENTATION=-
MIDCVSKLVRFIRAQQALTSQQHFQLLGYLNKLKEEADNLHSVEMLRQEVHSNYLQTLVNLFIQLPQPNTLIKAPVLTTSEQQSNNTPKQWISQELMQSMIDLSVAQSAYKKKKLEVDKIKHDSSWLSEARIAFGSLALLSHGARHYQHNQLDELCELETLANTAWLAMMKERTRDRFVFISNVPHFDDAKLSFELVECISEPLILANIALRQVYVGKTPSLPCMLVELSRAQDVPLAIEQLNALRFSAATHPTWWKNKQQHLNYQPLALPLNLTFDLPRMRPLLDAHVMKAGGEQLSDAVKQALCHAVFPSFEGDQQTVCNVRAHFKHVKDTIDTFVEKVLPLRQRYLISLKVDASCFEKQIEQFEQQKEEK